MFTLVLLLSLFCAVVHASNCSYRTEPFSCVNITCDPNRVTCTLGDSTKCICAPGFLWLDDQQAICDYQQLSMHKTRSWQGGFFFAPGAGLVHWGWIKEGTQQLLMTFVPYISICVGSCLCFIHNPFARLLGAILIIGSFISQVWAFILWILSIIHLGDGTLKDSNGCPLFDDRTT